jgi:hypothetical protein
MCTVLLPPGGNSIAIKKTCIKYQFKIDNEELKLIRQQSNRTWKNAKSITRSLLCEAKYRSAVRNVSLLVWSTNIYFPIRTGLPVDGALKKMNFFRTTYTLSSPLYALCTSTPS